MCLQHITHNDGQINSLKLWPSLEIMSLRNINQVDSSYHILCSIECKLHEITLYEFQNSNWFTLLLN